MFNVVQSLGNCNCIPDTLVTKVSSTFLFRHFFVHCVNDDSQLVVGHVGQGNVELSSPTIDPVAVGSAISQQLLNFIAQLLQPDVKASHLEAMYKEFTEEEICRELEILSLLDPSGKLREDIIFNIKSWVNRHVLDSLIDCLQNTSDVLNSIGLTGGRITSVDELSSESLLSDFGFYSKKFSSLVDCSHCNQTSPPLYVQIFQLFNNAGDLFSILSKHSALPHDVISSKLRGNIDTSFPVTSSLAQFFINLLNDPRSLWNSVVKSTFDDGTINICNLFKNVHEWMEENCHSHQRVEYLCRSIDQLKTEIRTIDEMLVSVDHRCTSTNAVAKRNFQDGILIFNLENITVKLQLPTGEDGTIEIPDEQFYRIRAEAILFHGEFLQDQVFCQVDVDGKKDEILNMCQLVDETLVILQQLLGYGFPIKSDEQELIVKIKEHNIGIEQQVETLRELRITWMTFLEQAQNGWFRGMHPKEISNFLLGCQVSGIAEYFGVPTYFSNNPAQSGINASYSVNTKLEECLSSPPPFVEIKYRSITYFQSDCLSNLFTDTLKVAVYKQIELNMRSVLICNWETSFSSLVALLSDSLVCERLIVGFDQLRYPVREKFYSLVKRKNEENFNISVIGCGTDFVDSTHCLRGILPSDVDLSSVLASCTVGGIYTSTVPGQGKTTKCLRECIPEGLIDTHTKTFNISGKVNISELIEKYLCDDRIDWSNHNIHLDIREPFDVLKRTFNEEHWTTSSKLTSQDFYNTAYILFSMSFLSGLRHNGSLFMLKNKVYIEFASYNSRASLVPFSWYDNLIDSLYPNKASLINELSFDFSQVNFKNTDGMTANVATIVHNLSNLLNTHCSLVPLFTDTFADQPPPHQSQWSFRLLRDIVSLLGSQLNYFDNAVAFSPEIMTLNGYNPREIKAIHRDVINLIIGFSRKSVLMSIPTVNAPDLDEVVINWDAMNHVMFMLSRNSPIIAASIGCNVPPALKSYIEFSANLPTILRGASGVGKTHLLECLSFILFWNGSAENPNLWEEMFVNITVNASTELHEVEDAIKKVNNLALQLPSDSVIFPILFLDECNASDFLGLISCLITNRKLGMLSLHPKVRLIAAINPYEKGENDKLLYNVHPEPSCLIPLMMDFGKLSEADEQQYVVKIVERSALVSDNLCSSSEARLLARVLSRTHKCLHYRVVFSSVPWMVSLRDVVRATRILKFLIVFSRNLIPELPTKNDQDILLTVISSDLQTSLEVARQEINTTLSKFSDLDGFPEGVVKTNYYLENIFAMFLTLSSRTPIMVIGASGTSKSLSLTALLTFLSKVNTTESGFHGILPHYFQGSHAATTKSIMTAVDRVETSAKADTTVRQALIMDEMSLLLEAPENPLKCLHSVLEPRVEKVPLFAFIGISNSDFDAAPSSRAIVIHREEPSAAELTALLKEIGPYNDLEVPELLTTIHKLMKSTANEIYPSHGINFFGLRDAYQLAKWLAQSDLRHRDRRVYFFRAYGGLPLTNNAVFETISRIFSLDFPKPVKYDSKNKNNLFYPRKVLSTDLPTVRKDLLFACCRSLQDPSPNSRHTLFIGSLQLSLHIVNKARQDVVVIQGSRFEKDAFNDVSYNHLSKVIAAAKLGKVIVLSGTEHINGALYDLISKNYLETDVKTGDVLCRVALGTLSNTVCHVNERTKIVLVVSEENLKSTPSVVLNRTDKFVLSDIAPDNQCTPQYEELFDDLGVINSLPKCSIVDSQVRQNFLYELHLVDTFPSERLCFLANPAHVLKSTQDFTHGPFLNLAHALHHFSHFDLLSRPLKIVALSRVFGESFDSLSGYDSVGIAKVSSVSEARDLETLLKNTGIEIIQKLLEEDALETAKSLLVIKIEGDEAQHYDFIETFNICEVLKRHFSKHADHQVFSKYLSNFDIVIAMINGEGLQLSPLSSFIAVYCDSINYVSVVGDYVSNISRLFYFSVSDIPQDQLLPLYGSLLVPSLMKLPLPPAKIRPCYQMITSLGDVFVHFFHEVLPLLQESDKIPASPSKRFVSTSETKCLLEQLDLFVKGHLLVQLQCVLSLLIGWNLLIPFDTDLMPSNSYLHCVTWILSSLKIPRGKSPSDSFEICKYDELPFIYFICALIEYHRDNSSELDLFLELIKDMSDHDVLLHNYICKVDENDFTSIVRPIFEYFQISNLSVDSFVQTVTDCTSIVDLFSELYIFLTNKHFYH
ncbi:hypothetical protein GEMRC1_004410 [Eukaryota sp. GEM-RC1]